MSSSFTVIEEFKSEHLLCLDLCAEPGVANELEQSFDRYATNFAKFQDTQWISGQNRPMLEDNDGCLSVSHVSSRTSSTIMTSRSKLRAAQAKRILAEHKLRLLSEKHEIQRAQRELEIKPQLLEQRCELEEASLEESVWRQAVNEDATDLVNVKPVIHVKYLCDIARDCSTVKNEMCSDQESTPTSQILARPESSQKNEQGKSSTNSLHLRNSDVSVTSIDAAFKQLATTLQEGFNLQKPELLTFNGTPTDYCKFIKNFETNIENSISDNRIRLSYLIQYCNGEAKSSIEDCVLLEPSDGYKRARSILYSRYGRPHVVARSYIDKLVNGPQLKASDINGLSRLALEMQKCEITLSQLGFSSDVDNSENLRRIVKRLPMHLRSR